MKKLTLSMTLLLVLVLASCGLASNNQGSINLIQGQDTVEINSTWEDAGAKFYINGIEYDAITYDEVDTTKCGNYAIDYRYEYSGEVFIVTRIVTVVDQISPSITLNLGIDTIHIGNTWVDSGVTVTDNSNEEIVPTISGVVDDTTKGTYIITYTAIDSSGNETSIERYVDVIE
jgi:hypothetical protein